MPKQIAILCSLDCCKCDEEDQSDALVLPAIEGPQALSRCRKLLVTVRKFVSMQGEKSFIT